MKRLALVCLATAVFASACGGERSSSPSASGGNTGERQRPVTIRGSDTMVILGQRFAEEYMKKVPGSVVQVNGGGSGTGFAALINGSVDLAQASRPIKDDERSKLEKARNTQVVETPVALDALAVFVHSSNPVRQLSIEQIASIYTGKITNWREIGGPDAAIVLYGRESSSGTYDYFREHVLAKQDFATRVQTLQGTAAIIGAVSNDPAGIGYGGIAYGSAVRALAVQKDAASAAVEPTAETVANGTYPISRELYFYTVANAPERVKNFVSWCISPEGQAVVQNVGYFPLPGGGAAPSAQ